MTAKGEREESEQTPLSRNERTVPLESKRVLLSWFLLPALVLVVDERTVVVDIVVVLWWWLLWMYEQVGECPTVVKYYV